MGMPATELDWDKMVTERLAPGEWPRGVLEHLDGQVVLAMSDVRARLPADHAMIPSPAPRAHVRHEPSHSQHSTHNNTRLSQATDFFMRNWDHAMAAFYCMLEHPGVNGIGLYIGTWLGTPRNVLPMLHLDLRRKRTLWVAYRENVDDPLTYVTLEQDPRTFHRVLGRALS